MKRLVLNGVNDARYIEEPIRELRPFDVLIKVKYACICGTDFEISNGESSFVKSGLIKYPVPIGHEWSGVVEAFGSEATGKGFKKGDRVISTTWVSCGECEPCHNGDYLGCTHLRSIGTIDAYPGAFAEYMILPYWQLLHLADNIPLEDAAAVEPVSIAHHAIVRSKVYDNPEYAKKCTALVIGTGGIGIGAASLLKNCYGVKKVIVAGRKDAKLAIAKSVGADVVVNTTTQDLLAECMKETDGKGVNLIIETSGDAEILALCVKLASIFAEICPLAFYSRTLDGLDIDTLVNGCINILGIGGQAGLDRVLKFIEEGKLSLKPIISHRITFDQVSDVFNHPEKYKSSKVKILVKVDCSEESD